MMMMTMMMMIYDDDDDVVAVLGKAQAFLDVYIYIHTYIHRTGSKKSDRTGESTRS